MTITWLQPAYLDQLSLCDIVNGGAAIKCKRRGSPVRVVGGEGDLETDYVTSHLHLDHTAALRHVLLQREGEGG